MAKRPGTKCKVYIHKAGTNIALATQRNATLSHSVEGTDTEVFSIACNKAFVTDDEAYATLRDEYVQGNNVDVYIDLPSGEKHFGNCTITTFDNDIPYEELSTWSISLQGFSTQLAVVK
ncbi:phage tail protein [Peribacillus simplex]|uniref:phage tail tube protein n=1 Tax=Peribacillus simplex TaxID=1478 RepID=UPI00203E5A5A|nr:phage tail tube protein [Peribacillus simplex]MCM3673199.1 phage tail protein [Peribacillus simplex]